MRRNRDSPWRDGCVDVGGGVELCYVELGSGDPVLFIPGFLMGHEVFAGQLVGLSSAHRVIAIDPRSQGRSTRTASGNTYAQQGRDIHALIEALRLENVALCGWSFGGLATYAYVAAHGIERLRAAVIIDMTPRPLGSGTDGAWSDGDADVYVDEMATQIVRDQRAFVESGLRSMLSRDPSPADRTWLVEMQLKTPPYAAIALLISAILADYSQTASEMDRALPVANVVRDDWMPQAGPWLAANAPNSLIWNMPSHLGFWEEPEQFNADLHGFLETM